MMQSRMAANTVALWKRIRHQKASSYGDLPTASSRPGRAVERLGALRVEDGALIVSEPLDRSTGIADKYNLNLSVTYGDFIAQAKNRP